MGGTIKMLGYTQAEPTLQVVELIKNILMYTKFKMISMSRNGELKFDIYQTVENEIEMKGIKALIM